jgi:NAD(P)H-dependent FMN reductase
MYWMRIAVVCGSHRNVGSYKVAQFVGSLLGGKDIDVDHINLSDLNIPLWDESWWDTSSEVNKTLAPIRDLLSQADGLVIISPERSGMVAPGLKNFFLLGSSQHEFAHKA